MKTKNFRPMQVLSVFFIIALAMAGFQPKAASAQSNAAPLAVATVLTTGLTPATDTGSLTSLLGTPIQSIRSYDRGSNEGGASFRTKYLWNTNNRYVELNTNRPIPRGSSSTGNGFESDAASADRPIPPPHRKHYEELPMPDLYAFWEGLNQGANRTLFGFGFVPPDTNGDTSGNVFDDGYYIETVNGTFAIWDYSKLNVYGEWPKTVYGPAPINTLFYGMGGACETTNDGDPIVLYDEQADRWLISQFALPVFDFLVNPYAHDFYQCIAISKTSDPLGGWWQYEYPFDVMNDYPHFGIWNDGYYMTINQFDPFAVDQWRGQGVVAFDRASMLTGAAADMVYFDTYASCTDPANPLDDVCFLGGMLPADTDGTPADTGTLNYVVQFDDDAWNDPGVWESPAVDQLELWSVDVDWTPVTGGGTMTHALDLPVNAFNSEVCLGYDSDCIPQPATVQGLDAIADRLMYRIQYRNFDTANYETMVLNHTVDVSGAGQAGIRWYELRNVANAGWTVYQQGDHAPDTDSRWMGSIAMDEVGNIALGYSISSAVTYPSIRYAGRLTTDPLGTLPRTEGIIANGGGSQTSTSARWGDYSSMSVAPDGCDFVYAQEYIRETTPANWWTRIGNFGFDSCWNDDTTSPETTIDSQPTHPSTSPEASFTFSATDDNALTALSGFECAMDGSAYAACTSPASFTGLASGFHTIYVRAFDDVTNFDQTPDTYTWKINLPTSTFTSDGGNDGWVLESAENSNVGGTLNASATTFNLGDDAANKQYRSILHFDTSSLPNTAVIIKATIKIRKQGLMGYDPFTTHNVIKVDIRNGAFGTNALQLTDFQSAASGNSIGNITNTPVANWYSSVLNDAGFPFFNLTGVTQFRLRFQVDDNNDGNADFMRFFSGNAASTARPQLIIEYYVP